MAKGKEYLTHKDLSDLVGISETSIKSYRKKFSSFIPVLSNGKPLRFPLEAGDICCQIRSFFLSGFSVLEIEEKLKELYPERAQIFEQKKKEVKVSTQNNDAVLENIAKQVSQITVQFGIFRSNIEHRIAGLAKDLQSLQIQQSTEKVATAEIRKENPLEGYRATDENNIVSAAQIYLDLPVACRDLKGEYISFTKPTSFGDFVEILRRNFPDSVRWEKRENTNIPVYIFFEREREYRLFFKDVKGEKNNIVILHNVAVNTELFSSEEVLNFFLRIQKISI